MKFFNRCLITATLLALPLHIFSSRISLTGFGVQAKGGIAPIIWPNPGCFSAIPTVASSTSAICDFQTIGGFHDHFNAIPWTVGFEFETELNECVQIYIDFQYRESAVSNCTFPVNIPFINTKAQLEFTKPYRDASLYIGFDYCCDTGSCATIFIGPKIGLSHYFKLQTATLAFDTIPSGLVCTSFPSQTVASGGGRVGFDCYIAHGLSIVFRAELLAQSGRKLNECPIQLASASLFFGKIGTTFVLPIEIGLRYTF